MHLFASFIFRAAMFFIKDILFIDGVGLSSDLTIKNGSRFFVVQSEVFIFIFVYLFIFFLTQFSVQTNNWQCKMVSSLWQYFTTANYSWILMEGLYLHNLILLALFSDSSNSIRYYILLGWGKYLYFCIFEFSNFLIIFFRSTSPSYSIIYWCSIIYR